MPDIMKAERELEAAEKIYETEMEALISAGGIISHRGKYNRIKRDIQAARDEYCHICHIISDREAWHETYERNLRSREKAGIVLLIGIIVLAVMLAVEGGILGGAVG